MKISKTLISQEEIENKISEIADLINSKYRGEELVDVGILKGAFIVVSDLAKKLEVEVAFDFMSIKSYYGSESSGQIKIVKDLEYDISNNNILIVEDIYDTGLTLSSLKKLLESRNPKNIESDKSKNLSNQFVKIKILSKIFRKIRNLSLTKSFGLFPLIIQIQIRLFRIT